jgi:hypothetical protein
MPDYYTVLAQKIRETRDDPVKIRDVVYEAARLALRWQVQEQWPALSIIQSKSHIRELEDAIARLEADAAGPGARDSREPAAAGLKAGRQSRNTPVESEEDDAPNVVVESHPQPRGPPPVESAGARGSREPAKAAAGLNASRQSRNATIESEEDDAAFRVVKELEDAVARLAGLKAGRQSRNAPVESEEDDAPNVVAESHPQPRGPPPVEPADPEAGTAGQVCTAAVKTSQSRGGPQCKPASRNATIESEDDDVALGSKPLIRSPGDDPLPSQSGRLGWLPQTQPGSRGRATSSIRPIS